MTESLALMTPDLSDSERSLILSCTRGAVADLAGAAVRGSVLRDLVRGIRPGWRLPQEGLRLKRVVIRGGLDLEGLDVGAPLFLSHVVIEPGEAGAALALSDARLNRISLHQSRIEGPVVADRAVIAGGFYISAGNIVGPLQLRAAVIEGPLTAEAAEIGDGRSAIEAGGVAISGALVLKRAVLRGGSTLTRARIGGDVNAEGTIASTADGPALSFSGAHIGGDFNLVSAHVSGGVNADDIAVDGNARAQGIELKNGGLSLVGASIARGLDLDGAQFEGAVVLTSASIARGVSGRGISVHGGGISIEASRAVIDGNLQLDGAKLVGTVVLQCARIEGTLNLEAARLYGTTLALDAEAAELRRDVRMDRSVVFGCISFVQAKLGASLSARGVSLKVDRGAAFHATAVAIARDVLLDQGFRTIGALLLDSATIGGTLTLRDSHVVAGNLAGATQESLGVAAGIATRRQPQVHDMHALDLRFSRIGRLVMPEKAEHRARGIVDLSNAHATLFEDFAAAWPAPLDARRDGESSTDVDHLVLKDFTCERFVNPAGEPPEAGSEPRSKRAALGLVARRRISWLEAQPAADLVRPLDPSAWRMVSDRLGAQGYLDDARRVAIALARWRRRNPAMGSLARWRDTLFDALVGYGHAPWRAIGWLIVTVVLFTGLYALAARQCRSDDCNRAFVAQATTVSVSRCASDPDFNPLLFSLDTALPLFSSGIDTCWRIDTTWRPLGPTRRSTASATRAESATIPEPQTSDAAHAAGVVGMITIGGLLEAARIIEMLLGLVLSALALAGFAGVFRARS